MRYFKIVKIRGPPIWWPNITGYISGALTPSAATASTASAIYDSARTDLGGSEGQIYKFHDLHLRASRSNSIYTQDGKVYPLSLHFYYCIKC